MLLVLLATFALGLGAAGIVLLVPRAFGLRPPRWAGPLAGGLAMFAFTLWNDYTWYERARIGLPESVRVAETYPASTWFMPWTLLVPRVNRFAAVDLAETRRAPDDPSLLLAEVLLVQRYTGHARVQVLFDCEQGRSAALEPDAAAAVLEAPAQADWRDGPDALVAAACDGRDPAQGET